MRQGVGALQMCDALRRVQLRVEPPMAAAVADKMDELSEVAYLIACSIGRGREISVRQGSCHSPIVAAHIVRAAGGQVSEVDR